MKIKPKFFALFLGISMVFAGLSSVVFAPKRSVTEARADAVPNSTYSSIYNDSFNNTYYGGNYNNVLIVYSGTAHGLSDDPIQTQAVLEKISINGTSLTTLGWGVIPFPGQTWFKIVYPNSVSEGDVLEVQDGLTVGDAILEGFKLKLNENSKWEYFVEPNATYSSIYSDSFNNTQKFEGYNQVLIVYSGPAHGLTGDARTITSLDVLGMISINGTPLTSLAIEAWDGQLWINIYYPNTVVVGDIMRVQDLLTVGNAIFNGFTLKLNANSKWEKVNLIEDDSLIQNSDYLLFTPSEVSAAANSSFPFYSANPVNEMANLNFGLQFKLNMTDDELGGYSMLKFGNAVGSENFVGIMINYKVNTYVYHFNGANTTNPLPGLTSISIAPNVDHIFEFYCLNTSESAVCFILGVDGCIIFKTSEFNITGAPTCNYFAMSVANGANVSKITSVSTTTGDALTRFSNRALLMDTIPTSNVSETDACKGANGHYAKAKAYYNNYLVQSQRVAFATNAAHANARARFIAWGAANGESISFNSSTGEIVLSSNAMLLFNNVKENNTVSLIIVFSLVSLTAILGYAFLRYKKQY